jgi:hypothetical protein
VPASASQGELSSRPRRSPSTPRRPHTSAGPRDKSRPGSAASGPEIVSKETRERDYFRRREPRPVTGGDAEIAASHKVSKRFFNAPLEVALVAANSGGSASSTSLSTSASSSSGSDPDEIREWEQELARIEMRSRRSSDLAGFANKRRSPSDCP